MSIPIGLGMITVRESTKKDFQGTLNKIGEIGYDYIEIVRHGSNPEMSALTAKEMKKMLGVAGLKVIASHEWVIDVMNQQEKDLFASRGLPGLEMAPDEEMIEYNLEIGNEGGIVCAMAFFNDDDQFKRTVDRMNIFGRKCVERGINFYYHNHFHEFDKVNGVSVYDRLLKEADPRYVKMEMDAYWVERGGEDPIKVLEKLDNRCGLIHVKDVNEFAGEVNILKSMQSPFTFKKVVDCSFEHPGEFTEVGEGSLKLEELIRQAEKSCVKCLIVEQDMMNKLPELESIAVSYKNLRKMTEEAEREVSSCQGK